MVAVLARLREAAARIARLLGIWAMHNALRTREGGQHYDCTAQICCKRARPLAMRRTPSIAAKAVGNRARGSIAATRRLRIFNQTRLSMLRRSSAALSRPQATYRRVHGAALHASCIASERIEWIKILKLQAVEFNRNTEIC